MNKQEQKKKKTKEIPHVGQNYQTNLSVVSAETFPEHLTNNGGMR